MGEAVAEFPLLRGVAQVYVWDLHRSESDLLVATQSVTAPASNLLGAGAAASYPLNPALSLMPRLELLVQSGEPGFGGGSGWITRVGSSVSYRAGSLRFEPAALLQLGGLEEDGVFGLVLRGGVQWQR
jgi:hypothetical protein